MKNKYDFNNIKKIKQGCNEWCCPCNEGRGCQANDACENACDIAFYNHRHNKVDEWNELMELAYQTMNTAEYDEVCRKMYEFATERR